jgi:hypothetical protein
MNTAIATVVKTRLLTVPAKTAPRLTGLSSPAQAEAVVRPEIEQALVELANLEAVATGSKKRKELPRRRLGRRSGRDAQADAPVEDGDDE